jgi:hypothetical protein
MNFTGGSETEAFIATAVSFASVDQSPFLMPAVNSCEGGAARAQLNTLGNRASTRSTVFAGSICHNSTDSYCRRIPQVRCKYSAIVRERRYHALDTSPDTSGESCNALLQDSLTQPELRRRLRRVLLTMLAKESQQDRKHERAAEAVLCRDTGDTPVCPPR